MANVKKDILWRVYVSFILVALLAGGVITRIVRLQTVERAELKQLADSMSTAFVRIEPIRGNIYAADGSLMSTSIPIYDVRLDMRAEGLTDVIWTANRDSLAWRLADYFKDKTKEQYLKELIQARKKGERYYLLKRKLTHGDITVLKDFPVFRLGRYKSGMIAEQKSRRILPFGKLAQRTIGYARPDIKPVGLEGAFEHYLAGSEGRRLMQKSAGGYWVPINTDNEIEPQDGQDIITTLDVNFQDIANTALEKVLVEHEADHGCAIVMEVATGKINAIANLTREPDGSYIEEYNYAIGESSEPGSTFKLISTMAMLEHGKASPGTIVDVGSGEMDFFGSTMRDSKLGHGVLTLQQAFELSSNVGISKLVYQAYSKEPSKFTDFVCGLKLNKPLGLPITGEGRPVVKTPRSKDWYGTTLPWMSIGYEVKVTPLQTLTVYNAVANGGTMVKPLFVTEIKDVGKAIRQFNTEIMVPKVCSDRTLNQLKNMMEGVVEHGTASNIKTELFRIAGKTGTAQIAKESNGYHAQKSYQSTFVGYFPANKPVYSCIVIVNNPTKGAYYGALVAGPAFKEIAEKIYARTATTHRFLASFEGHDPGTVSLAGGMNENHLNSLLSLYPTGYRNGEGIAADAWIKPQMDKDNKVSPIPLKFNRGQMPDVTGMVLSDALFLLENAGLKVRFSGRGRVTLQSILPGTRYLKGQIVALQLS